MEVKIWKELNDAQKEEALTRPAQTTSGKVQEIVENIISRIRKEGDSALFEFSKTLDKYEGDNLELSENEISDACSKVSKDLKKQLIQLTRTSKNFTLHRHLTL